MLWKLTAKEFSQNKGEGNKTACSPAPFVYAGLFSTFKKTGFTEVLCRSET